MTDDSAARPAPLDFEWDEGKRRSNIEKHGIDFIRAAHVFFAPNIDVPGRETKEERRKATALLGMKFVTVVYTLRDGKIRIISARAARDDERRAYCAIYGGGTPPQARDR